MNIIFANLLALVISLQSPYNLISRPIIIAFQNRALTQRSYVYYLVTKRTFKHIIQPSAQYSHKISALFMPLHPSPRAHLRQTTDFAGRLSFL